MLSPRIETDRLILRRYKESDIDAVYEIITDERMAKYIKYPNLTKDEELECIKKWISEADENKYEKWVMELKSTGEVVGNIDVNTVVKKHNYGLLMNLPQKLLDIFSHYVLAEKVRSR